LELSGNFDTMTTADYLLIEESIVTILNRKRSELQIISLKKGSIIVETSIDADNQTGQYAMINAMSMALMNGTTIGGLNITKSSIIARVVDPTLISYPPITDDSEKEYYRRIAIILGVVLPVALSTYLQLFYSNFVHRIICALQAGTDLQQWTSNGIEHHYELRRGQGR
jgi:hypothetical protein